MTTTYYVAGDRIGRGDLIRAYIQHHATQPQHFDRSWHQEERLMRATLNLITDEVAPLPGTITVITPRPPTQPTGKICSISPPRPPVRSTDTLTIIKQVIAS